jgi:hypothetical protein
MSDPLASVKKKLKEEIDTLEHELNLPRMRSTSTPKSGKGLFRRGWASSRSGWAISECST